MASGEQLELCGWCGKPAKELDISDNTRCSNDDCPIRYLLMDLDEWNNRAAPVAERGDVVEGEFVGGIIKNGEYRQISINVKYDVSVPIGSPVTVTRRRVEDDYDY